MRERREKGRRSGNGKRRRKINYETKKKYKERQL